MHWLYHLFSTQGFPTIAKYGQGWDTLLIAIFVISKGLAAVAYLLFVIVFYRFYQAWTQGRIDPVAAERHVPRVALFYLVSVAFDFLLQVLTIAGFWWPAYRFLGLFALLSTLTTFAAALKSIWALTFCATQKKGAGS